MTTRDWEQLRRGQCHYQLTVDSVNAILDPQTRSDDALNGELTLRNSLDVWRWPFTNENDIDWLYFGGIRQEGQRERSGITRFSGDYAFDWSTVWDLIQQRGGDVFSWPGYIVIPSNDLRVPIPDSYGVDRWGRDRIPDRTYPDPASPDPDNPTMITRTWGEWGSLVGAPPQQYNGSAYIPFHSSSAQWLLGSTGALIENPVNVPTAANGPNPWYDSQRPQYSIVSNDELQNIQADNAPESDGSPATQATKQRRQRERSEREADRRERIARIRAHEDMNGKRR